MKRPWLLAVLAAACFASPAVSLDEAHHYALGARPRVLFIGNSLTYFHSLPNTVATFTKSFVGDVVAPGYSLHQHWDDKVAQKEIAQGDWDAIVLQGKSMEFKSPSEFMEYGRRFGSIIRKTKSRIFLYETFANDGKPDEQPKIHNMYAALAKELHAQFVPVGDVFYFVHGKEPSIKLWVEDKLHPTAEGTYLAACVFYEYLTGKSPIGLSHQVASNEPYSVSPAVAKRLQDLAWKYRQLHRL